MTIMGMTHLGGVEMSEKNAKVYQELRETRRPGLLAVAKKMKLKVEGFPPSHRDLLQAIAAKKGLFSG